MEKRSEADSKHTWKLEDMVVEDSQWEQMSKEAAGEIGEYAFYKGRLTGSVDTLYACLSFDGRPSQKIECLYAYARMRSDEDTTMQKYQDVLPRTQTLSHRAAENNSFPVPEILSMDRELLKRYTVSDNGISYSKRALEIILARRGHTSPAEMEELLAQSYDAAQDISQILTTFNNVDVKFLVITGENEEDIQITHGNHISLMKNQDRRIRKDAFEGLRGVYEQFPNTLAATFSFNVKQAVFYAKVKKYASSREYYPADNEAPELVYDNLMKTVRGNITKLHEYTRVRGDVLGMDELHMYDLYVPMATVADRHYTYKEARAIVLEGLEPLGEEYLSLLRQGFDNRWIDVYENEDKCSDAYSRGAYGSYPYMLLNFHGTFNDVFILAHEMGHSIHTWYSDKSQSFTYVGYKVLVVEVASTCSEVLLIRHLLKKAGSRKERAYLLDHFLENFRGALFRQTIFAEFEDTAHKRVAGGESLIAEGLCNAYRQLNTDHSGPATTVDRRIDHRWERIPHFYIPLYVYQYVTGFSAAVIISSRIIGGEPGALEGYKKFSSGGRSMRPIDLLKLCGVDMSTTWPVGEAPGFFGELPEESKTCIHTNE